jgi:TRAP-type C4-dicarboxylate transport system permease small subunit
MIAERLQQKCAIASLWIERGLMAACAILLVFLSVTLFIQVLTRYVFQAPLPWTEEAARYALLWFGMLAAAAGSRRGIHFVFRWGVRPFSEGWRLRIREVVDVFVTVLLVLLLQQSLAYLDVVAGQMSTATNLDMRVPFAGIPAGIGALLALYLLEIADAVLGLFTGRRLSAKEAHEREVYQALDATTATEPAVVRGKRPWPLFRPGVEL